MPFGSASVWNDCWKVGNPNIATICADAAEVVPLQNHFASCGSTSQTIIASNCGPVTNGFETLSVSVYPNPTTDFVNICSNSTIGSLQLLDVQVRILNSQFINNSQIIIDISGFNNGIYFLKINSDNFE